MAIKPDAEPTGRQLLFLRELELWDTGHPNLVEPFDTRTLNEFAEASESRGWIKRRPEGGFSLTRDGRRTLWENKHRLLR